LLIVIIKKHNIYWRWKKKFIFDKFYIKIN